jgi:hypothetical protein
MMNRKNYQNRAGERGAISGLMFAVIGLSVLVLGLGSFGIWAFVAYGEAQSELDLKISAAVAEAKQVQADELEKEFEEKEKQPHKTFTAPNDYCAVRFQFPKTWSAHSSEQVANGGDFRAYFNPDVVPPITNQEQFGLRLVIEQREYDTVLQRYDNLVQKGDLKQSTTSSNGHQGTRLTGNFSKNIRGDAVIFRCRDKTISLQTDADAFKTDFEAIIRTLDYND